MLNSQENEIETKEGEMSRKKKKKRIYNPVTGTYYRIRQRSSNKGRRGTIIGKWKPPTKKAKKKKRKKR